MEGNPSHLRCDVFNKVVIVNSLKSWRNDKHVKENHYHRNEVVIWSSEPVTLDHLQSLKF